MGKKINVKASSRICKNEKQQFKSLIKDLRPKVYITYASNFKTLVQELTGNKTAATPSDLPLHHQPQIILEQHIQSEESSMEMSFDSLNSGNQVVVNEEINNKWWNLKNKEVTAFDSSMNIEAVVPWLLDIDTCDRFDDSNGFPQIEQELSCYNTWPYLNLPDQYFRDII